jgi:hypothetical protein
MLVYSLIPSALMFIFDCLLIKSSLIKPLGANSTSTKHCESGGPQKRTSFLAVTVYNTAAMSRKRRDITINLLVVTFLFLFMTLPASLCYAFFKEALMRHKNGLELLCFFDFVHFLNRSILFPTCFLTNIKFRGAVYKLSDEAWARFDTSRPRLPSCNKSRTDDLVVKL